MTRTALQEARKARATRRHFGRLGARCSQTALALALSLPLTAAPAAAQGFLGSPTVVSGSAGLDGATNTTYVAAMTQEVVIDWTTSQQGPSASFDFLPAGNTAYFTGPSASPQNYTVLNRIVSNFGTPVIELNGSIFSNFQDVAGGSIWFQAPGGFLVGSSAVINVANLMLTPGVVDTTGGLFGPGGTVRIATAADSTSFVRIAPGASIATTATDSYVAIVAPRILQEGTINVDGSTALIAGEEVTFSVNGGLFDVSVTVGSTDSNGIVHSGTTGGPASSSSSDLQRVAMVAVAKNAAMTMLLGGNIGYQPAASASQEGSAVLLSGGYNLQGDSIGLLASPFATDIAITDSVFSNVVGSRFEPARANGAITIAPGAAGVVRFGNDAYLRSDQSIAATVDASERIQFDGDAILTAGSGLTGGTINLTAFGSPNPQIPAGLITVAGALELYAGAPDDFFSSSGLGRNATGGSVTVEAAGGNIASGSAFFAYVTGEGEENSATGNAGDGQGGDITLAASSNGTLRFSSTDLRASGRGGFAIDGMGGVGRGGTISVLDQGGSLDLGDVFIVAEADGGFGTIGGDALGGRVLIDISGAAQNWDALFVSTELYAAGFDGSNLSASAVGDADAIRLNINGPGALTIGNYLDLYANAQGERSAVQGSLVSGGGISITLDNLGSLIVNGSLGAYANAILNSDTLSDHGDYSPTMLGGTINVSLANSSSTQLANLYLEAYAESSIANVLAGSATGGRITVSSSSAANLNVIGVSGQPVLRMDAYALANNGTASSNATGGELHLFADDGTIYVPGLVQLDAGARLGFESDGTEGRGGDAMGGSVLVEVLAGSTGTGLLSFDTLALYADGSPDRIMNVPDASPTVAGDGGNGTGGSVLVRQFAGTLSVTDLSLNAEGHGASSDESYSGQAYTSGTGTSGTAIFELNGGTADLGTLAIDANAFGGAPVNSAIDGLASIGGSAVGGRVEVRLLGGGFSLGQQTPLILSANATGGRGMSGDGSAEDGGSGTGGIARFATAGLDTSITIPGGVVVLAQGKGGNSGISFSGPAGTGGAGMGGAAAFEIAESAIDLGAVVLNADGIGGDGDFAGAGTGGVVRFDLDDSALPPSPSLPFGYARTIASLAADANGLAGSGISLSAPGTNGAIAMSVNAGTAQGALNITGDLDFYADGTDLGVAPAIALLTSQQPFVVGGNVVLSGTSGIELTLGSGAPFTIGGAFAGTSLGAITGTGPIVASGIVELAGDTGVVLEYLDGGSTVDLTALVGPAWVTADLRAADLVSVFGQTISLTSLDSLSFGALTTSLGDIVIDVAGSAMFTTDVYAGGLFSLTTGTSADFMAPLIASFGFFQIGTAASFDAPIDIAAVLEFHSGSDALFSDTVDANSGTFDIGGNGDFLDALTVSGSLSIATAGNGSFTGPVSGGDVALDIGQMADFEDSLTANGALALTAGTNARFFGAVSGNSVVLDATGNINAFGSIDALGSLNIFGANGTFATLTSSTGDIGVALTGTAQFNQAVQAADNLTVVTDGGLNALSTVTANSAFLSAGTSASFSAPLTIGTSLQFISGGNATFAAVTASSAAFSIGGAGLFQSGLDVAGELSVTTLGNGTFFGPVSASDASFDIGQVAQFNGSLSAIGPLQVFAGGDATFASTVNGNTVTLSAGGNLVTEQAVQAADALTLVAGASGTFASLTTTLGDISAAAGNDATFGADVTAAGGLEVTTLLGGANFAAPVTANSAVFFTGTDIDFADALQVATTLDLTTLGNATFHGDVSAGPTFFDIGGNSTFEGALDTSGTLFATIAGNATFTGPVSGDDMLFIVGQTAQFEASLTATGPLSVSAGSSASFSGPVTGAGVSLDAVGDITASQAVMSSDGLTISAANGTFASLSTSAGDLDVALIGNGQFNGAIQSAGLFDLTTGGTADFAAAVSADAADLTVGTSATFAGPLSVATLLDFFSGSDASFGGDVAAGTAIFDVGGNAHFLGALTATGNLSVSAGANARFDGPVSGGSVSLSAVGSIFLTQAAQSNSSLSIVNGTGGTYGALSAIGPVSVQTAGDALFTGAISGNGVTLLSDGSVTTQQGIQSGDGIVITGTSGTFAALTTTSGGIAIDIFGSAQFNGPVQSAGFFDLTTGAAADFGAAVSANAADLHIGGAASFAGPLSTATALDFFSAGDATFGNVSAAFADFDIGGAGAFQGLLGVTGPLSVATIGNGTFAGPVSGGTSTFTIGQAALFGNSLTANGALTVLSGGNAGFAGAVSGTAINLDAGGTLNTQSVVATADLILQSGGAGTFGTLAAGGVLQADIGGDALFAGTLDGNGIFLDADGSITTQQAARSGIGITIAAGTNGSFAGLETRGGSIAIDLPGNGQFNGSVVSSGGFGLDTGGSANFAAPIAVRSAILAVGTTASFSGPLSVVNALDFHSASNATFGDVSAGSADLRTGGNGTFQGTLAVAGPLSVTINGNGSFAGPVSGGVSTFTIGQAAQFGNSLTANGSLNVFAGTTASFAGIVSGNRISVTATNAISSQLALQSVTDLTITSSTGGTFGALNANGTLTIGLGGTGTFNGALTAPTLSITGPAGAQFNAPVDIAGAANVVLGDTASFSSLFNGQAISITSGDIDIGANGQLGSLTRTSSLILQPSRNTIPMFVGGNDQTGVYSLSNAEFGRLRATNTLEIVKTVGPIQVGTLTASALQGGQIGPNGALIIRSGTGINVTGIIDFTSGTSNAGVILQGGQIFVDSSSGGAAVHDASGGLQGQLSLSGSSILVGRGSSFQSPPPPDSLGQIGATLDQPSATPNDMGAISAGDIRVSTSGGLYIQNSGASTDSAARRGFTAGRFSVDTPGQGQPVDIAINGRVANPQGGFFTGLATASNILINGLSAGQQINGLTALSAINGCQIGANCNPAPPPPPPPPPVPTPPPGALPPQDTITAVIDSVTGSGSGSESQAIFQLTPIEIGTTVVLDTTPLVDEPVTSVGNEDLWQPSCDADGGQGCSSPED